MFRPLFCDCTRVSQLSQPRVFPRDLQTENPIPATLAYIFIFNVQRQVATAVLDSAHGPCCVFVFQPPPPPLLRISRVRPGGILSLRLPVPRPLVLYAFPALQDHPAYLSLSKGRGAPRPHRGPCSPRHRPPGGDRRRRRRQHRACAGGGVLPPSRSSGGRQRRGWEDGGGGGGPGSGGHRRGRGKPGVKVGTRRGKFFFFMEPRVVVAPARPCFRFCFHLMAAVSHARRALVLLDSAQRASARLESTHLVLLCESIARARTHPTAPFVSLLAPTPPSTPRQPPQRSPSSPPAPAPPAHTESTTSAAPGLRWREVVSSEAERQLRRELLAVSALL